MHALSDRLNQYIIKSLYFLATQSSKWGQREEPISGFYETDNFPFVPKVLSQTDSFVREVTQLIQKEADIPAFQDIAQLPEAKRKTVIDKNWKNLVLFLNGERVSENCELCPIITRVLEEDIPNVRTALLSILHGNTKIAEHTGEQNGLLRLHVPIMIPEGGGCGISVDGKVQNWAEEKAMIFDHSFRHYAWNDSNDCRIILIVDFERELRFPWSKVNQVAVKALAKTPHFRQIVERSRFPTPPKLNCVNLTNECPEGKRSR